MSVPRVALARRRLYAARGTRSKPPSLTARAALGFAVAAGLLLTPGAPSAAGQGERTGLSAGTRIDADSRLDPSAMRVATPCERGPGWVTVTLLPAATSEDGHTVEVSAEGVVDGSTWRIQVGWADSGQEQTFRRTADDERWALSTHVGAPESEETFLEVWAESGSGWCFAGLHSVGSSAAFGLGACGNGLHGLLVQRRDEVTVAALAFVLAVAPDRTRWHLDLAAKGVDERQSVAFDDYSNRWAELVSGVELVGAPLEPRFALAAESRKTGKTCRIRLDPAVLTVSAEERPSVPRMVLQPRRR